MMMMISCAHTFSQCCIKGGAILYFENIYWHGYWHRHPRLDWQKATNTTLATLVRVRYIIPTYILAMQMVIGSGYYTLTLHGAEKVWYKY